MRRIILFALLLAFLCAVTPIAIAQPEDPVWIAVSTETSGTGFTGRHVLRLDQPDYPWSGDPSDVLFDPGVVLGVAAGLDAFHVMHESTGDFYLFSTGVDFTYESVSYQDEDLLVYETSSGLLAEAFDVKDVLGGDYGLDAACLVGPPGQTLLHFSTKIGGQCLCQGTPTNFTDGDILVTDGLEVVEIVPLDSYFDGSVGLDALHLFREHELNGDDEVLRIVMSSKVDGYIWSPMETFFESFGHEDLLVLTLRREGGSGTWALEEAHVPWRGVGAFGENVGLDAFYYQVVPEPATLGLVGLGLGAVALRLRRRS